MRSKPLQISLLFILVFISKAIFADVLVLAAASLTNALGEIAGAYEKAHGVPIKTSFASSSVLAKQIENGISADVFISADQKWADYLYEKGKLDGQSRINLLGNTLVLIAPKDKPFTITLSKGQALAQAFEGKLCTGQTETVPAGKYAKEALQNLGMWEELKPRIVGTEDVRAALAFVARGECAAGIVYETDARISDKVKVIATFPAASHTPIVYPAAMISQAAAGKDFLAYLTQPEAAAVFAKYGFTVITQRK